MKTTAIPVLTIEFGGQSYPPIPSPGIPELMKSATAGGVCCTVRKLTNNKIRAVKLKSVKGCDQML